MKKKLIITLTFLFICSNIYAQSPKEIFDNGVLFYKKEQYQEAIDAFSKLIEITPKNADAYKNRGVSYLKQEKFDLAIKDFETAKKIFPELKGLYSSLGVAWYYKKEYAKAIKSYDAELEMSPENYVTYFNRSLCFTEINKIDAALEDLEKTLNLKPDFYWAICYKADLLVKKGDHNKAVKIYEEALKYDSNNEYAKNKLTSLNKIISKNKKTALNQNNSQKTIAKNPGFTIQTGAFQNKNNAEKLKGRLFELGFESRVLVLTDSNEKTLYLVRSGHYSEKKTAQKDFALIKDKTGITPVIRPVGSR